MQAATRTLQTSGSVNSIAVARMQLFLYVVVVLICIEPSSSIKIKNKLLGKCLQVQAGRRVSMGDCSTHESTQEWRWLPENHALQSQHTGECLTAPREQYEGVHLQPCIFSDRTGADVDVQRETSSQSWSCSKKGHLTLTGKGVHLTVTQESTLVFLSREHKQGSRWKALDNQTLCEEKVSEHHQEQPDRLHSPGKQLEAGNSNVDEQTPSYDAIKDAEITETFPAKDLSLSPLSTKSPADPTMIFFSMDYGMGWKITMLVLSSLALVLGTIILILNVYSNRRKKVVCVLKSYTPRQERSVPGSPMSSDRAPLTEYAMRLPHSTPTLQRGEILIEWKDGTVTPLYEA